jgi:hypothetical protein
MSKRTTRDLTIRYDDPKIGIQIFLDMPSIRRSLSSKFNINKFNYEYIISEEMSKKYLSLSEDKRKEFCSLVGGVRYRKFLDATLKEKGEIKL